MCHLFKLLERLILNRLGPITEEHLIQEQAGFRPGKSCTGQVLNLTQHFEDGFEKNEPTGVVFVDLTAAYDTVNHRRLLSKLFDMTKDFHLTKLIQLLLENRRFYVELNGKQSRWRKQRNGLPQGSVLASRAVQYLHQRSASITRNKELHLRWWPWHSSSESQHRWHRSYSVNSFCRI